MRKSHLLYVHSKIRIVILGKSLTTHNAIVQLNLVRLNLVRRRRWRKKAKQKYLHSMHLKDPGLIPVYRASGLAGAGRSSGHNWQFSQGFLLGGCEVSNRAVELGEMA